MLKMLVEVRFLSLSGHDAERFTSLTWISVHHLFIMFSDVYLFWAARNCSFLCVRSSDDACCWTFLSTEPNSKLDDVQNGNFGVGTHHRVSYGACRLKTASLFPYFHRTRYRSIWTCVNILRVPSSWWLLTPKAVSSKRQQTRIYEAFYSSRNRHHRLMIGQG